MTLDAWATIAQIGTFIVIAVTAVAGLIQLRHLRSSNQVAGMQTFAQAYEGPEYREAFRFVRTALEERLQDPAFRKELRAGGVDRVRHPEILVCNVFDQWGGYYRLGVIDRRAFMRHNAGVITGFWQWLEPVVALTAASTGGINMAFEHFEYLAIQAQKWERQHPNGDFPKGESRIKLVDPWRELDSASAQEPRP
jgi:hypothetical protein